MSSSSTVHFILLLPLLLAVAAVIWFGWTRDRRPKASTDISARPIIPAVIIDFDMPFMSMVMFLVKVAFAAIPALFILIVAGMIIVGLLGGFSAGVPLPY